MKVINNKKYMTYQEALDICREALEKHEGGKEMYLSICEIIEDYFEEMGEEE